jgi:DNA repair protein RadA/Sms
MAKSRTKYVCQNCGYEAPKWMGKCPECGEWNTFSEEVVQSRPASGARQGTAVYNPPKPINEIIIGAHHRKSSGILELDRVLGGGIVPGSVVLIGGDPGIGKSTLLTQVASNLSVMGGERSALYISGEESAEQIKLRADRLGVGGGNLYLASETNIEQVEACINSVKPGSVIIDSIQTMTDPALDSAAATVGQVRSCTGTLIRIAKSTGIPIFIVGHVTKEGAIAGPRVLEHMVDTVLYFEGDRHQSYRILRAVKNRFGSTDELGIFEMRDDGLAEVSNPSELFLSERPLSGSGSVVASTIEGTRPLLVEVQSLVTQSYIAIPRRMAAGVDYNRAMLVLAVLQKRVGLGLSNQDVYLNVAGGVKVAEPALDLAMAVAVASSMRDAAVDPKTIVIGEVGLAGEVRGVSQVEKRVGEAARLGFERAIIPARNAPRLKAKGGIRVTGVESVSGAVHAALGEFKRRRKESTESGEG